MVSAVLEKRPDFAKMFGAMAYSVFVDAEGHRYGKLTFNHKNGPNLSKTKEIVDIISVHLGGADMLSLDIAKKIVASHDGQYEAFQNNLEKGNWFYVTDAEAESRSLAAWLVRDGDDGGLYAGDGYGPDDAAPVVIWIEHGVNAGRQDSNINNSIPMAEDLEGKKRALDAWWRMFRSEPRELPNGTKPREE